MSELETHDSSRYVKLGVFVVAAVLLLLGCIVALGAGSLFQHKFKAQTFLDTSVGGLQVGANVAYRGVVIGKVTQIEFAGYRFNVDPSTLDGSPSNHAIVVEMTIAAAETAKLSDEQWSKMIQNMVDHGLRARITTQGLTGGAFVEMDYLDAGEYPAPNLPYHPTEVYIPYARGGGLSDTFEQISKIAGSLQKADLPKLVGHIDELATKARDTIAHVDELIGQNKENLSRALANVPETTARLRSSSARLDEILHDPRIGQLLDDVRVIATQSKTGIARASQLLADVRALIVSEEADIRSIISDLHLTAENAAALTDDARQNPSRLLFGEPPPHQTQSAR